MGIRVSQKINIIKTKLEEILGLDLRSLAILRIILACWLIVALITILPNFQSQYENYTGISNLLISEYFLVYVLLGFSFFFALLLLIGHYTTWATIACWSVIQVWHSSYLSVVVESDILEAITFWGMFLPLGAVYSFDSALNTSNKPLPKSIISVATIGLTYQLITLSHLPSSKLWLIGCLWIFPWRNFVWRCIAIIYLILVNLSFNFYFVVWLIFIPTKIWDSWYKKIYSQEIAELTINYDRDCGFCKKIVYLLRTILILPKVSLLEAQDNPSVYEDMQKYNSWVVEDYQQKRYYKWHGITYIVSISPILWWLAPILELKPLMSIGNKIYQTIANNRRLMGNFTKPFSFRDFSLNSSLLFNFLIIQCLLCLRIIKL